MHSQAGGGGATPQPQHPPQWHAVTAANTALPPSPTPALASPDAAEQRIRELDARLAQQQRAFEAELGRQQHAFQATLREEVDIRVSLQTCDL